MCVKIDHLDKEKSIHFLVNHKTETNDHFGNETC